MKHKRNGVSGFNIFIMVAAILVCTIGKAEALEVTSSDIIKIYDNKIAIFNLTDATTTPPTPVTYNLMHTLIQKTFSDLSPISGVITYGPSDIHFHFPTDLWGIRLSEHILNETNFTWTDYHVEITSETGTFFTDQYSPFQAIIAFEGTSTPIITQNSPMNGTIVSLSSNKKIIDFSLAYPVAPGEFLDIHIPVEGLPYLESGTADFTLMQYPTPIPEPATMLLLGSGLIGVGVFVRRKFRK